MSSICDNMFPSFLFSVLHEFGFNQAEIKIYITSLSLGEQPASTLAKKAGLKRGHTYNILASLIQKGLIQECIKNKVRYFFARSPRTFLSIISHKQDQLKLQKQKFEHVIPELEKIRDPFLIQPKVRFFQGVEGIKEIYEDTIRVRKQIIYGFADFDYCFPEQQNKALNDWIWRYATCRAKKDIWYVGILNQSKISNLSYKRRIAQKRKLKMLKNIYLPVEVNIYGDKVAIMSTYRDMVGLIIEDAHIAETLRNFHQAVWNFLPDYSL